MRTTAGTTVAMLTILRIRNPQLHSSPTEGTDAWVVASIFRQPERRTGSMSKETQADDPRQKTDQGSHSQTDQPWKGNPEKEQRNDDTKIDLEKWQETNTH
jgi:hypothetical protein